MGEHNYSLYEMETNINYEREGETATIYTANPVDIRKLDKLYEERHKEMILKSSSVSSRTYIVPKKWIKIRPNKILTEEQKEKLSENARRNFGKKESKITE